MQYKCKICKFSTRINYKRLYDNRHGYPGKFNICKCIHCGFMQTYPQLSFRELSKIYTNYYPRRDASIDSIVKYSKRIPTKNEIDKKGLSTTCHFQTKKGQKVLDIGCGTCQSLLEIKNLGGEAWGIDPDQNSKKVADKLRLKFHLGTIHNCKFPKNYFDLITASQVLEHEGDPIAFLKMCKKFLKPRGRIIMSFPNTDAFFKKIWGKNWLHWHIPYHLNHFNKQSIEILAKMSGYKIISVKTVTPNLWTILQIRSFLNNIKEGERDYMWDSGETPSQPTKRQNTPRLLLSKVLPFINNVLIVNRLIDKLGYGESFVIELTPR